MTTTTITIEQRDSKRIEKLAGKHSKKELITASMDYFEKYGINPLTHESPAKEMEKLIKRVDQVIAFIRKQEQDKLTPMCEAVSLTESRIKNDLDSVAKKKEMNDLVNEINTNGKKYKEAIDSLARTISSDVVRQVNQIAAAQSEAFANMSLLIDAQKKTGILTGIEKAYREVLKERGRY